MRFWQSRACMDRADFMDKEIKPKNSAAGNYFIGLALCFLCLVLMALPIYCAVNSGRNSVKPTNEEIILNWMDRTRTGKKLSKTEAAQTVRTRGGAAIREDQIKSVDKDEGGWVVTTRGNRLHYVPKPKNED